MNKPALYMTSNDLQRRDADAFSGEFVDVIGEMTRNCIDIGSGPGDVVHDFILPKLNAEATIVCSDISEDMVNFGKEKYKDNSRMSFVKLDIESSNLSEKLMEKFDHVTSFYCLHWCQNMCQVFKNIFTLLRPGGTTLLTFVADLPTANAFKDLAVVPRYQPYMKDVDRYIPVFQHTERPRRILKALLEDVGFEVHHCSLREKTYIFDSPDALGKYMLPCNPFVDRMPAELREEYKKDMVREAMRTNITFDKKTLFIYHPFVVYLRKPSNLLYMS